MNIKVEPGLAVGWTVNRFQRERLSACFVVKAVCRLRPGEAAAIEPAPPVLSGDRYRGDDRAKLLLYPSDFAPRKARADVVVVGTAHAPNQEPVPQFDVRLRLGPIDKSLAIFGRRSWRRQGMLSALAPSPPEPVVSVPLTWEQAFGGPRLAKNPLGRGADAEGELPAIENPRRRVVSPKDNVDPAGCGPVPMAWSPRAGLLGKVNGEWKTRRWPWLPEDFDYGFFNAAPLDQQVEGFLRGDEAFRFDNLHAEHAVFAGTLPGRRARCFLDEYRPGESPRFREVPLQLDTACFDFNEGTLVLLWRGAAEVLGPKLKEISAVVAVTESLAVGPGSADDYRPKSVVRGAEPAAVAQTGPDPEEAEFEGAFAEMERELAAIEKQTTEFEAAAQQAVTAAGAVPAVVPMTLPPWSEFLAANPELSADQAAEIEGTYAELQQMEGEFLAMDSESAAAPLSLAPAMVAAAATDGQSLADTDLAGMNLAGIDLAGADLRGARLHKAILARAKLAGADLTGADLTGADLTGADLARAHLDQADLTGARITGATLLKVTLTRTRMSGLALKGADLSGAAGERADFRRADLTGAILIGCRLPRADFTGATMSAANLAGAILTQARFDHVIASRIVLESADLAGASLAAADFREANFRASRAPGAVFAGSSLDAADLTRAVLSRAQFGDASMVGANFERADLSGAMFDDAVLTKARLARANLLRATLERANLSGADLRGSNLYGAGVWDAVLTGAERAGANVKNTLLS